MVISFQPTAETDPLIKGEIFQSGYAYLLKAAGSTFTFSVESEGGEHKIIVKARANTSTTVLTGRTYGFKVNSQSKTLKYKAGSAGPLLPDFGGASWGEYEVSATLIKGLNTFEIKTNNSYGGIDYVELIPATEPKTYTEEQLKSPEMASFLKSLGIYFKADLDKAVADAKKGLITPEELTAKITEATKGLLSTAEVTKLVAEAKEGLFTQAQVDQKILEVKDALPLLIQQAVESKTPTIQTQAIENYKSKIINIIEQS